MAHQWLIRPEAGALRPFTKRKVLCGYPDCPGAADYAVSFPAQDPVLYCTEHAARSIRRAHGSACAPGGARKGHTGQGEEGADVVDARPLASPGTC